MIFEFNYQILHCDKVFGLVINTDTKQYMKTQGFMDGISIRHDDCIQLIKNLKRNGFIEKDN